MTTISVLTGSDGFKHLCVDGVLAMGPGASGWDMTWRLGQNFGVPFGLNWGEWDTSKMSNVLSWLHGQNVNLTRIVVALEDVYYPPNGSQPYPAFLNRLEELASLCDTYGIGLVVQIFSYDEHSWNCGYPYPPYNSNSVGYSTVDDYNNGVAVLAGRLKNHSNVSFGLVNEPVFPDETARSVFFANLPSAINAARSAGFNGPIAIMGCVGYSPTGSINNHYYDNFQWAIEPDFDGVGGHEEHNGLFKNHGQVYADVHLYAGKDYDQYPMSQADIETFWMGNGVNDYRMLHAMAAGVPICMHEMGEYNDFSANAHTATYNSMVVMGNYGISWCPLALNWYMNGTEGASAVPFYNASPYWNSWGADIHTAILNTPAINPPTTVTLTVNSNPSGIPFTIVKVG